MGLNDKQLVEKYIGECLAVGFEYVGKGSRTGYSIVKCMVCGGVGEYHQGNIRRGKVKCSSCYETRMKKECLQQGFEWVRKVDKNNSLCRCLACGHEDVFEQSAMRDGRVKCTSCHEAKMKQECLAQGFEWVRKVDGHHSLCRCLSCGHEDVFEQSAMRDGRVKCTSCHEAKMKQECLAQGFEWVRKVDKRHSLCRCLTCGHQDTYQQVHIRNGEVACTICSPGHWNEPCFFYIARIIHENSTIIKIGVAADPHKRYTQYGLKPDADITEILRLRFDTKLEAVEFESNMKALLKPLHIHPDVAKLTLTYSGFTECYSHLAEDVVKESFV